MCVALRRGWVYDDLTISSLLDSAAFLLTYYANADAQKVDISSTSIEQRVLSLNFTNNGQHLAATVGQQIEITLGQIGGPQYGTPQVSFPAIRLKSVALAFPPNLGGPTFVLHFRGNCRRRGAGQNSSYVLENPDWTPRLTLTMTHLGPTADNPPRLHASMTPDQANTASWKNAWRNLLNDVQQTFTPTLPRLTRVEVELGWQTRAHPMARSRCFPGKCRGRSVGGCIKTVPVAACGHVQFVLPNGGS